MGVIPVPPQYKQPDFRKSSYWQLRGKLDVPKERFFSLPGCEKDGDSIDWYRLGRSQPFATGPSHCRLVRSPQRNDGWEAHRLMPMLVALDELDPLAQTMAQRHRPRIRRTHGRFLPKAICMKELRRWELTREELSQWQPAATTSCKRVRHVKPKRGAAE